MRCTAVALGYNLCYGLCGGLSPLAATWLVERTGDEIVPAFLVMASAAVTFVTLFFFRVIVSRSGLLSVKLLSVQLPHSWPHQIAHHCASY